MEAFILEVWRLACRHLEIEQAADRIARLLPPRIPADLMVVRRFDVERARIETATIGICRPGAAAPSGVARSECTGPQFATVLDWCRSGRFLSVPAGDDAMVMDAVAPGRDPGEWLIGPLVQDGQPCGALALAAAPGRVFTRADQAAARHLLEPMAVALGNDARMHELARLREASEADNRALLSKLDRDALSDAVVGGETGLRDVMERINQVAPTDAPVLILGETGTGKEVLARAIHSRSRRATGPVVRVNCGALPPGLIDSELFGHERGSFTGAVSVRRGWFERADGGTLFLDEIGELPLDAQVRLLRILQDGSFERVGAQKPLTVDVRIVAATHRDLHDMVVRRTFREDLWYRISVFPIHLPPLRDRVQDIGALAAHFAWRAGKRLGGAPLAPSPADVALLASYSWPGNVRELASVIERAAILGDGKELQVAAALGNETTRQAPARQDWQEWAADGQPGGGIATLDAAMTRHIERALRVCEGRIEGGHGAAVRLGINPHTLRARMKKLGIDWSRFRGSGVQGSRGQGFRGARGSAMY